MPKLEKEHMIDEFTRRIKSSAGILLVEFGKISAQAADELRAVLAQTDSGVQVVKNRVFRLALQKMGLEQVQSAVNGPTAVVLIPEDPTVVAKKVYQFSKEHEGLKIRAAWFDGRLLNASYVAEIAVLPGREALLANVVGQICGPLSGFVNVLKGNLRALVGTLDAISKKKS